VQAIATASGYQPSSVASAAYAITPPSTTPPLAATPTFSPVAGGYSSAQTVSMSSATPGATIYFTTDGTTPTTGSQVYSGAIMVSATETVQAISIASGYLQSNVGTSLYRINESNNLVGTNLATLNYSNSEQPFLNVFKSASGRQYSNCWWVSTSTGGTSTNEELFLQLDSDGYPTSVNGPAIGKTYTSCYTAMLASLGTPVGASLPYPSGSYTLSFQGAGTIVLQRDPGSVTVVSGSATASGETITSTSTSGTVVCIFNIASPSNGIVLCITATDPGSVGNHIRDIAIVQTSLYSSYLAGAIFHPNFLASVVNFQAFRFMDWRQSNNTTFEANPTAAIGAGSTSCTLSAPFTFPSGTYTAYFQSGESRTVTMTAYSTSLSWSGALTWANGAPGTSAICIPVHASWANRSLPSNASWSNLDGAPFEVCIKLCNLQSAHCWLNVPVDANSTYMTGLHNLVANGTGAQSGQLATYGGLNSPLQMFSEIANEIWNFGFVQGNLAALLGGNVFGWGGTTPGTNNAETKWTWAGYQAAQNASIAQTVWGSNFNRCIPLLGGQAASSGSFSFQGEALAGGGGLWSGGPPSNYPIKGICIAPYFDDYGISAADIITIISQSDGGLTYFFNCMTTNTMGGGVTLSSVPATGWIGLVRGDTGGWISGNLSWVNANYPSIKLYAYEGGQAFTPSNDGTGLSTAQRAAWIACVSAAELDPRMATAYIEYLTMWAQTVGAGNLNMVFTDCGEQDSSGGTEYWGAIQNVMQTFSPLSSAPPKWAGIQQFILGK
jgi:hypothetical protein